MVIRSAGVAFVINASLPCIRNVETSTRVRSIGGTSDIAFPQDPGVYGVAIG
jgi:hypothetical protein